MAAAVSVYDLGAHVGWGGGSLGRGLHGGSACGGSVGGEQRGGGVAAWARRLAGGQGAPCGADAGDGSVGKARREGPGQAAGRREVEGSGGRGQTDGRRAARKHREAMAAEGARCVREELVGAARRRRAGSARVL